MRRRSLYSLRQKALKLATKLLDNQVVGRRLKARLKVLLPRVLVAWIQRQKWKLDLAQGRRLVPEDSLTEKYKEALDWLIEVGGSKEIGDYLEFGTFNGTSLACMYRTVQDADLPNVRLFGFDSFEGLPESAANDGWVPGRYQIDYPYVVKWLSRQGIDWQRVFLIKGWYSDTLNDALIQQHGIAKASIIMVDCDAYQSAKEALDFCAPLIDKWAVVFFDDWHSAGRAARNLGEKRAFDEFRSANPDLEAEDLGGYNRNSMVFKLSRSNTYSAAARGSKNSVGLAAQS